MQIHVSGTINVLHQYADVGMLTEALGILRALKAQGMKIMAIEQQLLDAIAKIDAATTKQGLALTAEAATLQHISDDVDKLILAAKAAGVSDTTLAALQAQADKISAVSASLDAQAAFSTALAAKADAPVPGPVPPPTPVPPPVPTP